MLNGWLMCDECGARLVPEPNGYLACPRGHGRYRQPDTGEVVDWQEDEYWATIEPQGDDYAAA